MHCEGLSYFCCTAKLRKELGVKESELTAPVSADGRLGAWYADLIRIGSKKGVIFVHPETRYILVALNKTRKEIREFGALFSVILSQVLQAEGVGDEIIRKLLSEYQGIKFSKTSDRSVVGTMTEMVRHAKWEVEDVGAVADGIEVALSRRLSRTPIVAVKSGHFPYQELAASLRRHYDFQGDFEGNPAKCAVPDQNREQWEL